MRVIGPYNLTKKVGSGSYANVWVGRHAGTNQEVRPLEGRRGVGGFVLEWQDVPMLPRWQCR